MSIEFSPLEVFVPQILHIKYPILLSATLFYDTDYDFDTVNNRFTVKMNDDYSLTRDFRIVDVRGKLYPQINGVLLQITDEETTNTNKKSPKEAHPMFGFGNKKDESPIPPPQPEIPRNIDGEVIEKGMFRGSSSARQRDMSVMGSFGTSDLDLVFRRYAPDMYALLKTGAQIPQRMTELTESVGNIAYWRGRALELENYYNNINDAYKKLETKYTELHSNYQSMKNELIEIKETNSKLLDGMNELLQQNRDNCKNFSR